MLPTAFINSTYSLRWLHGQESCYQGGGDKLQWSTRAYTTQLPSHCGHSWIPVLTMSCSSRAFKIARSVLEHLVYDGCLKMPMRSGQTEATLISPCWSVARVRWNKGAIEHAYAHFLLVPLVPSGTLFRHPSSGHWQMARWTLEVSMRSVTGVIGSAADKIVSMSLSAVPYLPNTPTQFSIQPHLIPLLSSLFSLFICLFILSLCSHNVMLSPGPHIRWPLHLSRSLSPGMSALDACQAQVSMQVEGQAIQRKLIYYTMIYYYYYYVSNRPAAWRTGRKAGG